MWLPLIPKLAVNHSVIAPDLRGSGASGVPDSGYDKVTMARDIHALVQSRGWTRDRKSTRLNSSHLVISYAVFCLKKKKKFYAKWSLKSVADLLLVNGPIIRFDINSGYCCAATNHRHSVHNPHQCRLRGHSSKNAA